MKLVRFPEINFDEEYNLKFKIDEYKFLAGLIRKENPQRLLDIGISAGMLYTLFLPEFIGRIDGVEILKSLVEVANQRGLRTQVLNIDTDLLPYEDKSFNLVVLNALLEHTLNPKRMLAEIHRVLKPEGKVIIAVPNSTSIVRRWRHLRGDNPFHPLIDNLLNRDYMKRCAVFYSPDDLRFTVKKWFSVDSLYFTNMTEHDAGSISMKLLRLLGYLVPHFRDIVYCVGTKT